jgi:hypothetical protein
MISQLAQDTSVFVQSTSKQTAVVKAQTLLLSKVSTSGLPHCPTPQVLRVDPATGSQLFYSLTPSGSRHWEEWPTGLRDASLISGCEPAQWQQKLWTQSRVYSRIHTWNAGRRWLAADRSQPSTFLYKMLDTIP